MAFFFPFSGSCAARGTLLVLLIIRDGKIEMYEFVCVRVVFSVHIAEVESFEILNGYVVVIHRPVAQSHTYSPHLPEYILSAMTKWNFFRM